MAKVTYIEFNGTEHVVDVPVGLSVMRGAIDNDVPGIDADCGGQCACATCHVFVEPEWFEKTGARTEMEESMLEFAAATQENSRLACQIEMTDALDGLVVRMPDGQH
ncbi:MAG: 2Fe-2S iron-sulfur cluster-binding protein [Burkholderiaceae bacterium]